MAGCNSSNKDEPDEITQVEYDKNRDPAERAISTFLVDIADAISICEYLEPRLDGLTSADVKLPPLQLYPWQIDDKTPTIRASRLELQLKSPSNSGFLFVDIDFGGVATLKFDASRFGWHSLDENGNALRYIGRIDIPIVTAKVEMPSLATGQQRTEDLSMLASTISEIFDWEYPFLFDDTSVYVSQEEALAAAKALRSHLIGIDFDFDQIEMTTTLY